MSLDKNTVRNVASLARIKMTDEELDKYEPQLNNILSWIEQLSEVDTDNVEPLANVVDIELSLRKDEITDGGYQDDVLANAPESLEGFFVVPKVVE
jgi:aspartyl-tRNA(Asn)/glutamyl-tRNA(Gln) amidotransferase subunit C